MSGNEIMVALVFLLLGYWIVSFLLDRKPKAPWHSVLGVDPDASVEQIRAAYQALAGSKEVRAAFREAMSLRGVETHVPEP